MLFVAWLDLSNRQENWEQPDMDRQLRQSLNEIRGNTRINIVISIKLKILIVG